MDSTGDLAPYLTDVTDGAKVKPNSTSAPDWNLITIDRDSSGYRLTVKRVAFSDGTVWEDDGY